MRERSAALAGAALVGAIVAIVLGSAPVGAQISPGPLSSAHSHLEGIRKCLECHGGRKTSVDDRCLACHREIRWARDEERGLHHHTAVGKCAPCHPEHGGLEMKIIRWEGNGRFEDFDHAAAGWDLTGQHADVSCRDCHQPEHQVSPAMALRPGGAPEHSWMGMETSCVSCHQDPHEGRLGVQCASCHTTQDFAAIIEDGFDHDVTAYPLRGAHTDVACAACHQGGDDGEWTRPAFQSCADCHADPHAGRARLAGAPADCAACHGVDGFAPSTFTVARHEGTAYPLDGEHRHVACAACHGGGITRTAQGAARATFRFRPESGSCRDCHDNAHGTQLQLRADAGACESCHTVGGFSPSTFSLAAHQELGFPLEGKHAEATCRSCHGPARAGLPDVPRSGEFGDAGVMFHFSSLECAACHRDPHGGELDENGGCISCHGFDSFGTSAVSIAMHETFAFPLTGAHGSVPCFECHQEMLREPAASTLLLAAPARELHFRAGHSRCTDCHDDPHGAQFASGPSGGECAACHGTDAFTPASAFDHNRDARFPLDGQHARVACAECHASGPQADGTDGVVFRPVPHRCEDCHASVPPTDGGL